MPDGERVSPRERAIDLAAPIIECMESRYPENIIAAAVVNAILPIPTEGYEQTLREIADLAKDRAALDWWEALDRLREIEVLALASTEKDGQ